MKGRSYFREIKKNFTVKKLSPVIKRSNLQGKTTSEFFLEQLLWIAPFSYGLLFH